MSNFRLQELPALLSKTCRLSSLASSSTTRPLLRARVSRFQPLTKTATMATLDPKTVSEIAKAEGGPTKGSASAAAQSQMTKENNAEAINSQVSAKLEKDEPILQDDASIAQSREARAMGEIPPNSIASQAKSQADREQNFAEAVEHVTAKATTTPSQISAQDAAYLESRESRAMGGSRPPADSLSAEAKRLASMNEKLDTAKGTDALSPEEQSQVDREANLQDALDKVVPKLQNEPENVTQEDASLLRSRETRAHGKTEKGGVAAQVQSLVDKNKQADNA